MRFVIFTALFLALFSAEAAQASVSCCLMRAYGAQAPALCLADSAVNSAVPGDGLFASAAKLPAHTGDDCPCCPPGVDCSDCVKCGCVSGFVLPGPTVSIQLWSVDVTTESADTPRSRAIDRPGQPPKSILR